MLVDELASSDRELENELGVVLVDVLASEHLVVDHRHTLFSDVVFGPADCNVQLRTVLKKVEDVICFDCHDLRGHLSLCGEVLFLVCEGAVYSNDAVSV